MIVTLLYQVGWNNQPTCVVNFDDVVVPDSNLLGKSKFSLSVKVTILLFSLLVKVIISPFSLLVKVTISLFFVLVKLTIPLSLVG